MEAKLGCVGEKRAARRTTCIYMAPKLTANIAHGIAQRAITLANLCIEGPCQNLFYHNKNHFDSSPVTNRTRNQSGVKFIDKKYIKRIYM